MSHSFLIHQGHVIDELRKLPAVGAIMNPGMRSSLRATWATPVRLFDVLNAEFGFTLDVCAEEATATCDEWFGGSALERAWVPLKAGAVWVNPPYGRKLGRWIEKAFRESARHHQTVVCLLPARTDTSWFHDFCLKGEVRFLRGRLAFDDRRRKRAPFPSMIVIFSFPTPEPRKPGTIEGPLFEAASGSISEVEPLQPAPARSGASTDAAATYQETS